MSTKSNDPAKEIARIALREDCRFDGDILEEVLAYCWDQLAWIRTDGELEAIRSTMKLYDEANA